MGKISWRIDRQKARHLGKKYKINFKVVPFDEWYAGLIIEQEHTKTLQKLTDDTREIRKAIVNIVLDHLHEDPRYYYYLVEIENKREKYYETHNKKRATEP